MSSPFISIIVAAYNIEDYIMLCLNTLFKPTSFTKEIIIIDDNSNDNTLALIKNACESFGDVRFLTQENQGPSAVRNRGMQEAKGDYIFFVDGDDKVNMMILDQIYLLHKIKGDVVGFPHMDVYPHIVQYFGRDDDLEKQGNMSGGDLLEQLLQRRIYYSVVWSFLWKREFLQSNNIVFEENIVHEDVEFVFKALLKAKTACYINKPFYYYRQVSHASITSSFKEKNFNSSLIILPKLEKELEKTSYANNLDIKSHISAVAFELLHRIYLSPKKQRTAFLNIFSLQNIERYLLNYSFVGRYKVAAQIFKIGGHVLYKQAFIFFYLIRKL